MADPSGREFVTPVGTRGSVPSWLVQSALCLVCSVAYCLDGIGDGPPVHHPRIYLYIYIYIY
jgi:hypothetical protein